MTGDRPSLKHIKVFGCTAYALRVPRGTKFEAPALEGILPDNLDHGLYMVLVDEDTGVPRILESRHVTFNESRFPGTKDLKHHMSDEEMSDDDFATDASSSSHAIESVNDVSDDSECFSLSDSDKDLRDAIENDANGRVDADSADKNENETATNDTDPTAAPEEQLPPSRYARRIRRPPPDWSIVTSSTALLTLK